MERQSFARWRLPKELDGVLLLDDHRETSGRFGAQQRHVHDELELHFVERGRSVFLLTKGRLVAPAGTLLWIPPGKDHLLLEATGDFRRWMLLCRRRVVQRVLPVGARALVAARSGGEQSRRLPERRAILLRETFAQVSAHRGEEISLFNAAVGFALARAWLSFESAAQSAEPTALHPAVESAVRLLRDATSRISLPELARACGVTDSHLSKLFTAQLGLSITDFRNRAALERFLALYGDGSSTTTLDAALEAGFGSYPQFHRVFRKEMGYPPAGHRKRVGHAARRVL